MVNHQSLIEYYITQRNTQNTYILRIENMYIYGLLYILKREHWKFFIKYNKKYMYEQII